jgi:uncharacterized protein (TIGR03437 family)
VRFNFGLHGARLVLALSFSMAAFGQVTGSITLSAGQNFSFDTGKVVSSGGDIQFTSTGITFVGSAMGTNLTSAGGYATLNQGTLDILAMEGAFSTTPIATSALNAGDVIGLETSGGNLSKAMVTTAATASSVTIAFTTYTGGGESGGPTITAILNNSSTVPAGFPNYGIAPSSIFQVQGTNLATPGTTATGTLQNVYPTGTLPTILGGATASVTVSGTTVTPALWYASPTQLALELPSNTPTGTGTLMVTVGTNSASAPITVVPAAFGIDVYNGNTGVLQDSVSGAIISPTNSAKNGETLTLWGTGVGADTADSDTNYTTSPHAINTPVQLYIGGVQVAAANITYVGSLGYPGVNGIIFTVPSGVPQGCEVSIAVVANGMVSNVPTAAFMPSGGVCQDAYTGLSGTTISSLTGKSTVNSGSVSVIQGTSPSANGTPITADTAMANFTEVTGSSSVTGSGIVSVGGCTITQTLSSTTTGSVTGLNPGTIMVTPPGGSAVTLASNAGLSGSYIAMLPSGAVPTSGGTFAFAGSGGTGATAVGAFNTTINFPNPIIDWTNQSASATVTRASGQTYTWTGGGSGTFVTMSGFSSGNGISGGYICVVPQSDLSYTVPAYVTGSLPAGTGTSTITNTTAFTSFTASGLNYGTAFGAVTDQVNTTWR